MIDRSIVITGSSGTVGTALALELLDEGCDVTGVDARANRWHDRIDERTHVVNLTTADISERVPSSVDLVVHLAANARVHKLVQNPQLAKENVDTTFAVLEYARAMDAALLFVSSREVYGNGGQIIHDETNTSVEMCESPYTASKLSGEAFVHSYSNCYDLETVIVRLSNVYGKYDASDRVVPQFVTRSMNGQDLRVYGNDKILDFTYLGDCVNGLASVIERFSTVSGTTFNIASGRGASLETVATLIAEELNSNGEIVVEASRTGEVSKYIADITRANRILGYEPQVTLKEGIRDTIAWYENRPAVRDEIATRIGL